MTQAGNSQERRRLANPERRKSDRARESRFLRTIAATVVIGHENKVLAKLTVATAIVNGQKTAVFQPELKNGRKVKREQLTATPRT